MTVYFNGRSAVHAGSDGLLTTTSVNYTGSKKQQVSYTNTAQSADATNTSSTVFVDGHPVCHKDSYFSKSKGDEPGDGGGIHSGTVNGIATFETWSSNIFINGIPAVRNGDMMRSNKKNTDPAALKQPGYQDPMAKYLARLYTAPIVPTPYQVEFDVAGFNVYQCGELLRCHDENNELIQEIASGKGNSQDRGPRRLSFANLPTPAAKNCQFEVPAQAGPALHIPLGLLQPTSQIHDVLTPIGQAAHALVPVYLAWQVFPDGGHLQAKPGDFSDIARFSDQDRPLIWPQLMQAKAEDIKNKPWTSLIKPDLLTQLQQDYQPKNNQPLRAGWVYVFMNGFLWRELKVLEGGTSSQFSEVDLQAQAGQDRRPATGHNTPLLLLLARLNNAPTIIELAFSDTQWSWPRINYFGGMEPSDPRLQGKNLTPPMNIGGAAARAKRFVKANLLPFVDPSAQVDQTKTAGGHTPNGYLFHPEKIPTLCLPDPVGIATRVQADLFQLQQKFQAVISTVQADPLFGTAHMTYQLFFNPNIAYNQGMSDAEATTYLSSTPMNSVSGVAVPMNSSNLTQPNIFLKNQGNLNKTQLEKVLAVNERALLRALITQQQITLISIVQDVQASTSLPRPLICSEMPFTFNDVLLDSFALSGPAYAQGFATLSGIIGMTTLDPSTLDSDLDIPLSQTKTPPPSPTPAAITYTLALFEPHHTLFSAFLPTPAQVETARKATSTPTSTSTGATLQVMNTGDNDGSGAFQPTSFAQAADTTVSSNADWITMTAASTVALYGSTAIFIETLGRARQYTSLDKIQTNIQHLTNLLIMTGQPSFLGLQVQAGSAFDGTLDVAGYSAQTYKTWLQQSQPAAPTTNITSIDSGKIEFKIKYVDDQGKFVSFAPGTYKNTYFAKANTGEAIISPLTFTLSQTQWQQTIKQIPDPLVLQPPVTPALAHLINKSTAGINAAFALFNAAPIMKAWVGRVKNASNPADRLQSLQYLTVVPFALDECVRASAKQNAAVYYQWINQYDAVIRPKYTPRLGPIQNMEKEGFKLTPMAICGMVTAGLGITLGVMGLMKASKAQDTGNIIANSFLTAGSALQGLGLLGRAAKEKKEGGGSRNLDRPVSSIDLSEKTVTEAADKMTEGAVVDVVAAWAERLVFLADLGWIGDILLLLSAVAAVCLYEDPITRWAKASPFGIAPEGMDNQTAVESLLNFLLLPTISTHPTGCVDVALPWFIPGRSSLELSFKLGWGMQAKGLLKMGEDAINIFMEQALPLASGLEMLPTSTIPAAHAYQEQIPVEIYQRVAASTGRIVGMEYHYNNFPGPIPTAINTSEHVAVAIGLAKARLHLNNQAYKLPFVPADTPALPEDANPLTILDPSWYHAKPTLVMRDR